MWAISLVVAAGVSFFAGTKVAPLAERVALNQGQVFYATVDSISGNSILVTGVEINDINHRAQFKFAVEDTTRLTWRGFDLAVEDLRVGDVVCITYAGGIGLTYPGYIANVLRVQLLSDR